MKSSRFPQFGRRAFVVGPAALATVGMAPMSSLLRAGQDAPPHRFVSLYFQGAWDVLLGPDPRDPATNPEGTDLGTSLLPAAFRDPRPVTIGDEETLWGAALEPLERHAETLTLFRGVNMNTVAHPTGRAYVNTLIPPAGVVPKGDSIATRMTAGTNYEQFVLPNVSIRIPSFNHSFAPEVTGIGLGRATDVTDLVEPVEAPFSDETTALLRAAQDAAGSCVGENYDDAPGARLDVARERVRDLLGLGLAEGFDFGSDTEIAARYEMVNPNSSNDPGVIAATVWRLLDLGLSTSVTAQLQGNLDSHGPEWADEHPARLLAGFNALSHLLDDLRTTDPSLTNTTVLVHSEFSRTPGLNGRGGRDHWFANSILVFGGGLRRGVFGATVPETLGLLGVDFDTGLPSAGGEVIRPEHIGATLADARGLPYDAFRVDPLTSWIA